MKKVRWEVRVSREGVDGRWRKVRDSRGGAVRRKRQKKEKVV